MSDTYEVVLDGPGKNALGTDSLQRLRRALREASGRPVLVRATPGAFSAGLHLREVAGMDSDSMRAFLALLDEVMTELYLYPGPTVACAEGHAIAGGCVILLACDYRVAAADPAIRIGLNEVALGLRFPPRIFRFCKARIAAPSHEEVFLGARLVDPATALGLSLLDAVSDRALALAREKLGLLSAHPREGYAAVKQDLRGEIVSLREGEWPAFLENSLALWTSPALKARLLAVLDRSKGERR